MAPPDRVDRFVWLALAVGWTNGAVGCALVGWWRQFWAFALALPMAWFLVIVAFAPPADLDQGPGGDDGD